MAENSRLDRIDRETSLADHSSALDLNPHKIEESIYYHNFPIQPPSTVFKDERLCMKDRPRQFTSEYKDRLDHFMYEFFTRDDGMYQSIKKGFVYVSQAHKRAREEMMEHIRQEQIASADIIYDTQEGGEFNYRDYKREQKEPIVNKYVEYADQEF